MIPGEHLTPWLDGTVPPSQTPTRLLQVGRSDTEVLFVEEVGGGSGRVLYPADSDNEVVAPLSVGEYTVGAVCSAVLGADGRVAMVYPPLTVGDGERVTVGDQTAWINEELGEAKQVLDEKMLEVAEELADFDQRATEAAAELEAAKQDVLVAKGLADDAFTASETAGTVAAQALVAADGKSRSWFGATAPTRAQGLAVGDSWFNGSKWQTCVTVPASGNPTWRDMTPGAGYVDALNIGSGTAGNLEVGRLSAVSSEFQTTVVQKMLANSAVIPYLLGSRAVFTADNLVTWAPQSGVTAPHAAQYGAVLSCENDGDLGWVYKIAGGNQTDGTMASCFTLLSGYVSRSGNSGYFDVEGGQTYRYRVGWGVSGSTPAGVNRQVRGVIYWYDAAGTHLLTTVTPVSGPGSTGSDLTYFEVTVQAPPTAVAARLFVQKNWWSSGNLLLASCELRLAADASLIVDGSVSANKLLVDTAMIDRLATEQFWAKLATIENLTVTNQMLGSQVQAQTVIGDRVESGMVVADAVTVGTPGSTVRPSLKTWTFESTWDLTDWTGTLGTGLALSSTQKHSGSYSMRMTVPKVGDPWAPYATPNVTVQAGSIVEFWFHFEVVTSVTVTLTVSGQLLRTSQLIPANTWTQMSVSIGRPGMLERIGFTATPTTAIAGAAYGYVDDVRVLGAAPSGGQGIFKTVGGELVLEYAGKTALVSDVIAAASNAADIITVTGTFSFTSPANGEAKSGTQSFGRTFAAPPVVVASTTTGRVGIGITSRDTMGFAWDMRNDSGGSIPGSTVGCMWIAVGTPA